MQGIYEGPLGIMGVVKTHDVFLSLKFGNFCGNRIEIPELDAYFCGKIQEFSSELAAQGTSFQQRVWQALNHIPYGETRTYQQVANFLEQPLAVRAVSNAIAANPLHILIPCHRVIRSNGAIGGYQGGIERKKELLELEHQMRENRLI